MSIHPVKQELDAVSTEAAFFVNSALKNDDDRVPKILVVGPRGCGKSWVWTEACKDVPFLKWDISAGPPTMVGSSGLSRFFSRNEPISSKPEKRLKEAIVIEDVDSALIAEGSVRSPGVTALLAIVTDPMRPVILTSTEEDPFKFLGTSAAGKSIRAAITHLAKVRGKDVVAEATENEKTKNSKAKVKKKEKDGRYERDTLYVLTLEAAAGHHSNDALSSLAANMRRILLSPTE